MSEQSYRQERMFRIPAPKPGTFTAAEWAAILAKRAARAAAGTTQVGDA